MSQYPKYKYHSKHPARVVKDAMEESKLGHGWIDTPVQEPAKEIGQAPLNHYISPDEQKERDAAHIRVLQENQRLREELAKRDAVAAASVVPEQEEPEAQPEGELEETEEETEESDSDSDEGLEEEPFEEPEQEESEESGSDRATGESDEQEEPADDEKPRELTKAEKKAAAKKAKAEAAKKRSGR